MSLSKTDINTFILVTYPIYKKSLSKLDNFQCHQKTDWNKVVVQDYKCQQIVSKVDRQHFCGPKDIKTSADRRQKSEWYSSWPNQI